MQHFPRVDGNNNDGISLTCAPLPANSSNEIPFWQASSWPETHLRKRLGGRAKPMRSPPIPSPLLAFPGKFIHPPSSEHPLEKTDVYLSFIPSTLSLCLSEKNERKEVSNFEGFPSLFFQSERRKLIFQF